MSIQSQSRGADVLDAATEAGDGERRGSRGLTIALAAAGTVALVLWFAVSRSRSRAPHDPRAYPGSQSQDLPGTLERYHLRLPDCAQRAARYYRHARWEADLFYLHFIVDKNCLNQFLVLNGMFQAGDAGDRFGLPFDARTTAGFGWPQDPARRYRVFTHRVERGALVEARVAVHRSENSAEVYLIAAIV
jgi:hypothetical protein